MGGRILEIEKKLRLEKKEPEKSDGMPGGKLSRQLKQHTKITGRVLDRRIEGREEGRIYEKKGKNSVKPASSDQEDLLKR